MEQTARDLMRGDVLSVPPDATVAQACKVMKEADTGSVFVGLEEPQGIFTERDVARRVVAEGLDPARTPVGSVMTRELVSVDVEAPLAGVFDCLTKARFRHIPVTRGGQVVGIISVTDFVRVMRLPGAARTRTGSILIVEDDEGTLEVLKLASELHSYNVITAENGKEGLKKAMELKPDIILLDIEMPDMDGHEMNKRLKSDPETRDIPVIIVSAAPKEDTLSLFDPATNTKVDDYFQKPVQLPMLLKKMGELIRHA